MKEEKAAEMARRKERGKEGREGLHLLGGGEVEVVRLALHGTNASVLYETGRIHSVHNTS